MKTIDAARLHYRELNEQVRAALASGGGEVTLTHVAGQRYIGAGLGGESTIRVDGIPGNDLGAFMDGPTIRVDGNAQDGVGNTMNAGLIIIRGDAGDILGHSMRGGRIYVRGGAGYRVGIHMKAYEDRFPTVIVGCRVGDYAGEYMAGGLLVVLGLDLPAESAVAGAYVGTGMHGGETFRRGPLEEHQLGREVGMNESDAEDRDRLRRHLAPYCKAFALDLDRVMDRDLRLLRPVSHRPYGRVYVY